MLETQTTRVMMRTQLGDVFIDVYPQRAPESAADFLRYVDAGLYSGAAFYRTVRIDNDSVRPSIEVVQAGLTDQSGALPPIRHESTGETGLNHIHGTVSLARNEPGTGTAASFFICIGAQPALDCGGRRNRDGQGFAAFGRVVQGIEVIETIHRLPTRIDSPVETLRGQYLAHPVTIDLAQRTLPVKGKNV